MFYIEHSPRQAAAAHAYKEKVFFFISGVKIDSISNKHGQCAKQFVAAAAEAKWKKNILLHLLNYNNNLCLRTGCNVLTTI